MSKAPAILLPEWSRLPRQYEWGGGLGPPHGPGVYAVCARNHPWEPGAEHVLYIGSSKNVAQRVNNPIHHFRRAYNRLPGLVYIRAWETEEYVRIEREEIRRYRPILNIRLNG